MAIGMLLIGERFLPAGLPALVPSEPNAQIIAGIILGLCIGTASTFLGVAGGELLIPTLLFIFGADIHTAGSAALFVSIPTVCIGLVRYRRIGLLPNRATLIRVGLPMGVESLIGAAAGGIFAGSTSAEVLKLLLRAILIAAAVKAFLASPLLRPNSARGMGIRRLPYETSGRRNDASAGRKLRLRFRRFACSPRDRGSSHLIGGCPKKARPQIDEAV
jgi:uncharacterized membrane protein YfcA